MGVDLPPTGGTAARRGALHLLTHFTLRKRGLDFISKMYFNINQSQQQSLEAIPKSAKLIPTTGRQETVVCRSTRGERFTTSTLW